MRNSKPDQINVLILQTTSIDSVDHNLKQIEKLIEAETNPIDLICLPENSLMMRVREGAKIQGLTLDHPVFSRLQSLAKERSALIHLGSVPLVKADRLANASVIVTENEVRCSYEKIHLFDIQIPGDKPVRESDVFTPGSVPSVFEWRGWKFGQTICYDIRFSELYHRYAKDEVDVLLVPAAFLVRTGHAHWEVLLRARAIESQAYVVAAAQAGVHRGVDGGERHSFGRSTVVHPWGNCLWQGSADQVESHRVVLVRQDLEQIRRQIPMKDHRRL